MARSIVLRFDAVCFDCGRSLSAGTTARWFGKGRVSCCGGKAPLPVPSDNMTGVPRSAPFSLAPDASRKAADAIARAAGDIVSLPPLGVPSPQARPAVAPEAASRAFPHLAPLAKETGLSIEQLAVGMGPADVAKLATSHPNLRLLVRLSSGARLIVPAVHCAHVVRCIEESCIDRIRDVALLADGGS